MTKEEAIEALKEHKRQIDKKYINTRNSKAIETVLSMLKEKDKQIDLMAKYIEDELTVDEFCSKENCYADNYEDGHCQKCLNCIKQYFERKVEDDRSKRICEN